ncbi:MAG: hypothetical protein ACJ736_33685 [Streptomyces sp.]
MPVVGFRPDGWASTGGSERSDQFTATWSSQSRLFALLEESPPAVGRFHAQQPVAARRRALIGMLVLDQHLGAASWLAITMIVAANAISVGTAANKATKKTDLLPERHERPFGNQGIAR